MKRVIENKKISLGLITMALVFAIIVVSSFWPFILDPSQIATTQFITDELIITAITLSTTISMLFVAQASNASNPASEIARAKVDFRESLKRITHRGSFYQWIKRVLQNNDKKEIVKREMGKLLIPEEIYDLSESEIKSLTLAQKIGDKFYGPYDAKKLKAVIKLKENIAKIKFVAPNYYTSVHSIQADKTLSELAKNENAKKVLTVVIQLLTRVIIIWIGASILGSLVRDLSQEAGSTAQAWMRFLSRAFSFGSSCFLGYNMGCRLNDLDAFYITKRIDTHTLFIEDKTFVPVDEAKEAFKKRVLEEEHKLINNTGIEYKGGNKE